METHITIDFYDDLRVAEGTWDETALREAVRELARREITTIHWIGHGPLDNGFWDEGTYLDYKGIGHQFAERVPNPLQVVCDEAHERGMHVISVIKPWDLAFGAPADSKSVEEASEEVRLPHLGGMGSAARFIRENPHTRLRLHPSRMPDLAEADLPIHAIRLWHETAGLPPSPEVSVFVSDDNRNYERYEGPMQVEPVRRKRAPPVYSPAPEEKYGEEDEYACLELTELQIDSPFLCIQFDDSTGITNTLEAMVEVLGPDFQELTFTYGIVPNQPWGVSADEVDWQEVGIAFDSMRGSPIPYSWLAREKRSAQRFHMQLDELPLLGIARGRNEYLDAPIEYGYPEVQEWLLSLVEHGLESGVDGIDIRQGSHSQTLDWENYGFNEPVVEAFRRRYGVDPLTQPFDRAAWRHLRAEFFDEFLEKASKRTRDQDADFLAHLQKRMDLPADQPSYVGMAWHWRDWITDGVIDAATFKSGDWEHPFYHEALGLCHEHDVDTIFRRKPSYSNLVESYEQYFERAETDGFDAVNIYEMASVTTLQEDGTLQFHHDRLWDLVKEQAD